MILGATSALATGAAAYALTFFGNPEPIGRALAMALGLCVSALPTGLATGLFSGGWRRAAAAAMTSGGLQLAALTAYCLLVWKGSWDLPALVGFAVFLQAAAMIGAGWLAGLRRRGQTAR
ncbi:MAG TPA: hypothetical protein VEA98_08225 [Brevundimonas sp.]|nr:hypothetical protein [Brevundimonas sp.]